MSEPYRVEVTAPARRQLQRLPSRVAPAIVAFVAGVLPVRPPRLSRPLTDELAGLRSARRGDYRVLFEIDEEARMISVFRIGHRSDVYRSR